jgi:aldehyde:ferredoxin oxidoreductase
VEDVPVAYVYAGKYLRIDLTTDEQRVESIAEEDVRQYYLGSGYAAMLMYREMDTDLPALDPRSPIYIFNGLMSGTFAPTGCRSSWCGRSPLTGIWNESNMGGHWGAELRFAGLDGLVITGRAEKPVYLYVHDGMAEVRDASAMWGMETYDAYDAMLAETDPKARAAVIGPAGENLVHFANIMQGGREHSRRGRGGMGAVLGSKNVKGIVCRAKTNPPTPTRPASATACARTTPSSKALHANVQLRHGRRCGRLRRQRRPAPAQLARWLLA